MQLGAHLIDSSFIASDLGWILVTLVFHKRSLFACVAPPPTITMAPNKRFKSTTTSIGPTQAARGNPPLPYIINKHRILFADDEHLRGYDAIFTQKILATLHLSDVLCILLNRLGWLHFVTLQEAVCEQLIWEFTSSIVVELKWAFQGGAGYIRF